MLFRSDSQEDYEDGYAMYYLAQSYRNLENKEKAIQYYTRFIEIRPGTKRATTSQNYLNELQTEEVQN